MFLIEHLITNSMAAYGPERFNKSVQFIADLPFLPFLEIFGIFLPIAFHAIYGIKIAMSADYNSAQYPYMAKKRYVTTRDRIHRVRLPNRSPGQVSIRAPDLADNAGWIGAAPFP
ncbi:MAG: hypothetical protein IPK83_15580 [Planctomycetes bacterium]|nr:hypothetical protein [Planctomycetota bacterium]